MKKNKHIKNDAPAKSRKQRWNIKDEKAFYALLWELDNEMIDEFVPITARIAVCKRKITQRFGIVLPFVAPNRRHKQGDFGPEEIAIRIRRYFAELYRERINVSYEVGRTAFPLRGDFYAVRCPLMFNYVTIVCEPESFGDPLASARPDVCNVLNLVEDMTPSLACSITAEEVVKLCAAIPSTLSLFLSLNTLKDQPLIEEVLSDYDAAVLYLVDNQKHPGQSQWATLQAVEKLLKAYLTVCGVSYGHTHQLGKLVELAVQQGLPQPPDQYVEAVHCEAGVRYGEIPVTGKRALWAHLVSIELGEVIAVCIGRRLGRQIPRTSEPLLDGIPFNEWLAQQGITLPAMPASIDEF